MNPSCPLYYKPADILAAFSHACERDAPAAPVVPGRRFAFAAGLVAAVAGSTHLPRRLIRSRRQVRRPEAEVSSPLLPFRETVAEWTTLRPAERGTPSSYRSGLRSHFALVAPVE